MVDTGGVDLLSGGPGGPPQPWSVRGGTATYEGCVMVPAGVAGGNTGPGTINTNDLYIQGTRIETALGRYLPLTGGTLTGPLNISDPSHLNIGGGLAGNTLASNGLGGTYWTNVPPGGPYLKLTGGVMSGLLTIPGISFFSITGGNLGQIIRTDGQGNLTWINQGGGNLPQPTPPQMGFVLATDGATTPYWTNVLPGGPFLTIANAASTYLPLAGGALTGPLTTNSTVTLAADPAVALGAATKQYVDNTTVTLSGDTMTGPLILNADPTAALGAVTKQYVDNKPLGRNRLINGSFLFDQRNEGASVTITAAAALAYTADRWWVACTGANGTVQRGAGGGGSVGVQQYLFSVTAAAGTTLMQFGQRIEASNCFDMAGQNAILSFMAASASNVILTWTLYYANTANTFGTIAAPTKTQIATGTFPAAGFSATWAFYSTPPIAIPSGATNGIELVFSWTTTGSFTFGNIQLEKGNILTPFERRFISYELQLCQRYYEKSYPIGSIAGAVTTNGALFTYQTGFTSATLNASIGGSVRFAVVKYVPPTITMYSPATGAAGKFRDVNGAADGTPTLHNESNSGFTIYGATVVAATNINFTCHWIAVAEIA